MQIQNYKENCLFIPSIPKLGMFKSKADNNP